MAWGSPRVLDIVYQSQQITVPEWVSLWTLCLAPLVAHIVARTPPPSYLTHKRPRWHDYLALYNPISVVWRYAAIFDRRLHTLNWGPSDMAAANAIFWTDKGWDGSEEMVAQSIKYCASLPRSSRASVISGEFVKTVIVTLQGIQAIYIFTGSLNGTTKMPRFAVDTALSPIAFLGLVRLPVAFWLTSEYAFASPMSSSSAGDNAPLLARTSDKTAPASEEDGENKPLKGIFAEENQHAARRRPIFRAFFITPVIILWVITLMFLIPGPLQGKKYQDGRIFSLNVFLETVFSAVYCFMFIAVYTYCAWRYDFRSTIIPCISSPWYKLLAVLSVVGFIPVLVVSALGTRRTICGVYTTLGTDRDAELCAPYLPTQ
ncbi:hypothetical protein QBC34DRAFT_483263 [Podospora aff. communis PSN243]|uniref:Uncharacterized protein n=1 Tax=Podospora aff. communis PSN243 TaxID=3040156 RepID=A0AAV9GXV8_9PEZI|nr:hypothetical protein QBC34DRAFT_483263 [Podospora aff. communis PSN243]